MRSCPSCGGAAPVVSAVRDVRMGQRTVAVENEFIACEACGEEYVEPEMMDRTLRRAAEAIRKSEGLLMPEEIKAIREGYGLTQTDFERLINAGPKTVTRWERGTVAQNGTADTLMRVLRDHPDVAVSLAYEKGVVLRMPDDFVRAHVVWDVASSRSTAITHAVQRPPVRRAAEARQLYPYGGNLGEVIGDLQASPSPTSPPRFTSALEVSRQKVRV